MPNSWPLPSNGRNEPACGPPVTSMISSIPALTRASIDQAIIGRSQMGRRCLLVMRVNG